jgi:hypothetical protein
MDFVAIASPINRLADQSPRRSIASPINRLADQSPRRLIATPASYNL